MMKHMSVLRVSCLSATWFLLLVLGFILFHVFYNGVRFLSWEFLTMSSTASSGGGIFPAIVGTLMLVSLMSVLAVPLGIVTGIYLNEYASHRLLIRLIRIAVNNLSGVPSIVFGLFGLGFFVNFVGKEILDAWLFEGKTVWGQPCLLWAALTLTLLTLPLIIVSTEEALKCVPQEIKDSSLALGATRFQTIALLVVPHALPGILNGIVLAVGRAAGEVAPILFIGAAVYLKHTPSSLTDQFMHLGYHIYSLLVHSHDTQTTEGPVYATVLVLLGIVFLFNMVVFVLRIALRR